MSGGSMDYAYRTIIDNAQYLDDREMAELAVDLSKVFHDAEWWHSADSSEDEYRTSVAAFKQKWFHADRSSRLLNYVNDAIEKAKQECLRLI